jgi:hypothetical protein
MRLRLTAAAILAALALAAPEAAGAASGPVSSHAQVHTCCMPAAQVDRVFAESKAMGAAFIRVDFELNAIFEAHGMPLATPDWSRVDHVLELSRQYDLPVLGIVLGTPTWISACAERWADAGRCAATDPAEFGRLAGELAAHADGQVSHWEILNEPDGEWAFDGTPEDYARMLSASHDAIRAREPEDRVALGGVMTPWKTDWLERVFATPGADAAHKFEIASVHLRGKAGGLAHNLTDWRAFLAQHGFSGPVWVTEHGYSADPTYQTDPAYVGGESAQAAYIRRSLLNLAEAGADQVFVTLRDWGEREWASEGVVDMQNSGDFAVRRKPAFDAVRRFAGDWPSIVEWRARQHLHERRSATAEGLAASSELRGRALRRSRDQAGAALRAERRRLRHLRARRARARAAASSRRVRRLRSELRRIDRELGLALAATAAYRGDQVANAVKAADYRQRVEG